jgi:hypothetical protein
MEKTNIKDLQNVMYDIFPSLSKDTYEIRYVDFCEGVDEIKAVDMPAGIMRNDVENSVFHSSWIKTGNMNSLIIKKEVLDIGEKFLNRMIKSFLEEQVRKDFIEEIKRLSELNRLSKNVPPPEKYDLNLQQFKEKGTYQEYTLNHSISRRIKSNLIKCSSLIATHGRIGPGNYLLMNKNTFNFLDTEYFSTFSSNYYKKDQFDDFYKSYKLIERNTITDEDITAKLSTFDIIIDPKIDDDIIIEGRKNADPIIGICAVIWTDSDGNIRYEENENGIELRYNVINVGFYPQRQYYAIHLNQIFSL